jgi:flagellar basal-body rod modification protein FlgD
MINTNPASATNATNAFLDQYAAPEKNTGANKELGRDAFMKLLITQMNNQNPLEPQENGDFISQLAEFSSLEGIETLTDTVKGVSTSFESSRALQASSLVGQQVVVPNSNAGFLELGGVTAAYLDLPANSTSTELKIKDENGSLIETIQLGFHKEGALNIRWDGWNLEVDGKIQNLAEEQRTRKPISETVTDDEGNEQVIKRINPYPPGAYTFVIQSKINGTVEEYNPDMSSRVDSVTLSAGNQVMLNLAGGKRADINDIKMILE